MFSVNAWGKNEVNSHRSRCWESRFQLHLRNCVIIWKDQLCQRKRKRQVELQVQCTLANENVFRCGQRRAHVTETCWKLVMRGGLGSDCEKYWLSHEGIWPWSVIKCIFTEDFLGREQHDQSSPWQKQKGHLQSGGQIFYDWDLRD